ARTCSRRDCVPTRTSPLATTHSSWGRPEPHRPAARSARRPAQTEDPHPTMSGGGLRCSASVDVDQASSSTCCFSAPPAGLKPAFSASSAEANQNSASVASYHCEPGTWYRPLLALPLTSYPSGAEPS